MKAIFYDSDILSSFLMINKSDLLKKLFDEIIIPEQVFFELTHPKSPKHMKSKLKELIKEEYVKIHEVGINTKEYEIFDDIICEKWTKGVGDGEASAIAAAICHDGILASNNITDVKFYIDKFSIPLLTSSIIQTKLFEKKLINEKKVEKYWREMILKNRKLPAPTFSKYYEKLFKKDFKEFNCNKYYKDL